MTDNPNEMKQNLLSNSGNANYGATEITSLVADEYKSEKREYRLPFPLPLFNSRTPHAPPVTEGVTRAGGLFSQLGRLLLPVAQFLSRRDILSLTQTSRELKTLIAKETLSGKKLNELNQKLARTESKKSKAFIIKMLFSVPISAIISVLIFIYFADIGLTASIISGTIAGASAGSLGGLFGFAKANLGRSSTEKVARRAWFFLALTGPWIAGLVLAPLFAGINLFTSDGAIFINLLGISLFSMLAATAINAGIFFMRASLPGPSDTSFQSNSVAERSARKQFLEWEAGNHLQNSANSANTQEANNPPKDTEKLVNKPPTASSSPNSLDDVSPTESKLPTQNISPPSSSAAFFAGSQAPNNGKNFEAPGAGP